MTELAYLHPNHFTPDPKIVSGYGLPVTEDGKVLSPFFIMRFASLNAHHDSGIKGINTEIAQRLIDILAPHGTIYITSERPLEPQFEQYRIRINPLDMHHVMAFASLYIGDSQTMAAEAGVLGVPFVRFNDFVGRIGYLRELEDVYRLGFGVHASPLESTKTQINTACAAINIDKEITKKEESTAYAASSVIANQSANEQDSLQPNCQSPSTDANELHLSDSSEKKIISDNPQKSVALPKKEQPSGVEDLVATVEALVGMDAEERRRVFAERRERMLSEKIDCAKFLTWFIENYPSSVSETRKADAGFWERFK